MLGRFKPFQLWVDRPKGGQISAAICAIDGWFRWSRGTERPELQVNGAAVVWVPTERPDVRRKYAWRHTQGFRLVLDTSVFCLDSAAPKMLELQLASDGKIVARHSLELNPDAVREGRLATANYARKQQWLRDYVACPLCAQGTGELTFFEKEMRCAKCGETYPIDGSVLDFLPQDLRRRFHIEDGDDVSAHYYDEVASDIIENVRRKAGKVLDCGSGMRQRVDDAVVCLDVAPFPSVDILAVNQKLPFKNDVFDAVFSLNVLEHVSDPFASAGELVRVLKPGGTLYCCIPFLQPEHGYPHHYFNATRSGLRQLFPKDLEIVRHVVPGSGEPVWSLRWFLSWYAQQLPAAEKRRFLQLRLKDILDEPESSVLDRPWVKELSEEGKWKLASTTAAVFRKPV